MLSENDKFLDRRYVPVDISIVLFACRRNIRHPLFGIRSENTSPENVFAAVGTI